ncbi:hypothetical protein GCM10009785_26810 [Brooklawnia cerclae]|uniref:Portal protein n=1 Tax=Brooklawnia cerclae TaxID=349934 RepID=A0ABX0SH73_9ACTN|nr:hypothetical protein [Brooklawnia cerclae]NIH57310.1 hypothetical protein [Brooklawnia cerclae]
MAKHANQSPTLDDLAAGYESTIAVLQESLADVQRVMDRDNLGWMELSVLNDGGFDADFRRRQAARILVAATANPIIKRGLALRGAFVWGGGAAITVRDTPDQGQDVGAVVQAFLDDPQNLPVIVDTDARIGLERDLGIVGEVVLCLPTDPVTGRVRVRKIKPDQITGIRVDPEDDAAEQLYLRQWSTAGTAQPMKAWYPAINYHPSQQPGEIDGAPVMWDQPIRFVRVNQVGDRGVGDAFAAVPWADAYKRFLEDWAQLMRSLSRIAVQLRTRGDKTAQAAARLARSAQGDAGQGVALDPTSQLEAVSTSGARFDADSGRPLAVMAAAALDLPVTTLLGDPGVTGARAVAEQVSDDSWAAFDVRRDLWRNVLRDICGYVIDSAVTAPAGPLRGTVTRDGDRQRIELPDGDGCTVEIEFPKRVSDSVLDRMKAIQIAGQSETLPPLHELRMYLQALDVKDADEIIDAVTDEDGNFIPLDVLDSRVRQMMTERGEA